MNVHPQKIQKQAGSATAQKPSARALRGRPPFECITLVLQGGGALGAYQAGVYEALAEAGLEPDWVAGISIGSINAAIIAGNPPETRVEKLRTFWEGIAVKPWTPIFPMLQLAGADGGDFGRSIANRLNAFHTMVSSARQAFVKLSLQARL
jgi:NTE family protein